MSLTADPPNGTVPATGGTLTHNLVNGGAEKLVFKVRSSNNTEYRVKPVFGFVDPGASTKLEITRLAGPPKEDKMVVQFAPAPPGATDPAAAFASVQPAGNVTIPLSATAPAAEAPPAAPPAEAPPAAPAGEAPPAAPPPQ
ncbi:hypothetical protein V3C99_005880 [Haemonchus contortus]